MSLSKLSLLDIPDLPMIKILEKCNFMSLICLRKTCHNLRNFIDYLTPETEVTSIEVNLWLDAIQIVLDDYHNNRFFPLEVLYRKCKKDCMLEYFQERMTKNPRCPQYSEGREKVAKCIKDANFMDVFCMDLSVILKMQKTELRCLRVYTKSDKYYIDDEPKKIQKPSTGLLSFLGCCSRSRPEPKAITEDLNPDSDLLSMCNRIYDTIETSLLSRHRLLRVRHVILVAIEQRQILQVLPYTDPNVLSHLHIWRHLSKLFRSDDIYSDELVKLEHWRKLKNVEIWNFPTKGSIEHFGHFERANVTFDVATVDDVLFLKKKFLSTHNLMKFDLYFTSFENEESFDEIFGQPFHLFSDRKYPIPGTNQYLSIKKWCSCFMFERRTFK